MNKTSNTLPTYKVNFGLLTNLYYCATMLAFSVYEYLIESPSCIATLQHPIVPVEPAAIKR